MTLNEFPTQRSSAPPPDSDSQPVELHRSTKAYELAESTPWANELRWIPLLQHRRPVDVLLPPQTRLLTVENAGAVVNHADSLTVNQLKPDVLSGRPLDRDALRDSRYYVPVSPRQVASGPMTAALLDEKTGVIVVVAPRHIGSTIFAQQLLAQHTPTDVTLLQLAADWRVPSVGKLPILGRTACQLDLKDPQSDLLSAEFMAGLGEHAGRLNAVGSRLILTVAKELWAQHRAWSAPENVRVVELSQPPDAQQLVEQQVQSADLGWLLPYVRTEVARNHLRGRDAVDAMRAAGTVLTQWRQYRLAEPKAAEAARGTESPAQLDSVLRQRIEQALGDWREELNVCFADLAPHGPTGDPKKRALTLADRCLLISLAVHQQGSPSEIASAARELERSVVAETGGKGAAPGGLSSVLAGRGIRSRLTDLGAEVDSRDRVDLARPGFGEALITFVWDNYEIRDVLRQWLVQLPNRSAVLPVTGARVLSDLALRHEDTGELEKLRHLCVRVDRSDVLISVAGSAVRNEHVGSRVWGLLYDWARQSVDIQLVVVEVCRSLLMDDSAPEPLRRRAMTRLRRVGGKPAGPEVRVAVLQAFEQLADTPDGRTRLGTVVQVWRRAGAPSNAGKLALLVLMRAGSATVPWPVSGNPELLDFDLDDALGELFADPEYQADCGALAAGWLVSCAHDDDTYLQVQPQVVALLRRQQSFEAGAAFMQGLGNVRRSNGSRVADEIYRELVDPRLHDLFPPDGWTRTPCD
ncbi:hypothetical protein [Kitasatospora sp. NBC_01266]|uniref:hypothetical protein n=1 Tax=Kitasatospora sp. NBC_01266 TaxID=2903572 RepID=UPI002E30EA7B|nr:hypothetical protein [Kitasatospora sp. NBC_01266]